MTPQEFKAWFEGFTEAFDRLPTKAQWARVKERVSEIDGKPITERIFVDRYYPAYWTAYGFGSGGTVIGRSTLGVINTVSNNRWQSQSSNAAFNSTTAMHALGKSEAQGIAQ